jgi:peptide/nickel transport system substrate-binding protein
VASTSAGTTASGTQATPSIEAKQGGHLTIGQAGEPDTLDMYRTESSISWEVGWAIFDTLIIADEKLALHPDLATKWEAAPDGTVYSFTLRDGVKFHDGTPFDAAAVKFNLDRTVDPATGSLLSIVDIGPYDRTEIIDTHNVKVTLKSPYGVFIRAMSLMEFPMLSPKIADMAVEDVGQHPIGTGPFKFKQWVTQDHIEVERFADYNWGPSPPYAHSGPAYLDGVTFKFIPDAPTRVAAIEANEVDAIMKTPGTDVSRLKGEGYELETGLQTGMPTGFIVNTNRFPTDDPAVRKAINLGLNRDQISKGLYAGQEAPGYCPLTPTTFAYWDCTGQIKYDPDGAKSALEGAGWTKKGDFYQKDGKTCKLDVYIFGTDGKPGEAFQAAIRPIGIDCNLQVVPFTQQKDVGFSGKHSLMLGRFDAPDPSILTLLFHSRNIGPDGFTWTHLNESNPDLQKQLDDLLDLGTNEPDQEKRKEIYAKAQQIIVDENMFIAMKYDAMLVMMNKKVSGWKMNDLGYQPRIYDVSISS